MDVLNIPAPAADADRDPLEWDGLDIADLLGLSHVEEGRFRTWRAETNEHGRIYGGQILGQAMFAASQTVPPDRRASCIQLLFAAGGLPDRAIDFEVATLQEGKRFSARNVRGVQAQGRILCDANVAFAKALDSPAMRRSRPPTAASTSTRNAAPDWRKRTQRGRVRSSGCSATCTGGTGRSTCERLSPTTSCPAAAAASRGCGSGSS